MSGDYDPNTGRQWESQPNPNATQSPYTNQHGAPTAEPYGTPYYDPYDDRSASQYSGNATYDETPYSAQYGAAPTYDPSQPWQGDSPAPAKKSRKPLIIGSAGILAVAAVLIVLLVAGVFSGGGSYRTAETEFIDSLFSWGAAAPNTVQKTDFTIAYEPSRDMKLGIYDIELEGSIVSKGAEALVDLALSVDGDRAVPIQAMLQNDALGLAIPDLSDYTLQVLLNQMMTGGLFSTGSPGVDMDSLDAEKLQATLSAIGDAYFKAVEPATQVQEGVQLRGGGVTVICNQHTINFTGEVLVNFLKEAIAEIKKNDNLMDYLSQLANASGGVSIEDTLDEVLYQLEDSDIDDERLFRMTVWVQGNKIISRKIDRVSGLDDFVLSYQILSNATECNLDGQIVIPYSGTLDLSGNFLSTGGAWNGSAKLTYTSDYYDEETFSLTVRATDLKTTNNLTSGNIRVTSDFAGGSMDIRLSFDDPNGWQTVKLTGRVSSYGQEIDLGSLSLSYKVSSGGILDFSRFDDPSRAVYANDYSDDNVERAQDMLDELMDVYQDLDSGDPVTMTLFNLLRSGAENIISMAKWYDYY